MSVRTRALGLIAASLACWLSIAACGSSGNPATGVSTVDSGLQFARCMRAHGVSNFPDPNGRGQIEIAPGSGVGPQSPAFQSAQRSCGKLLPKGGPPTQMSASQRAAALRFAQCMRAHGQPDFPDPTLSAPAGAARVLVMRGMVFALGPGVDPKSPGFRQAASRCGVTPPGGAPGPS